MCHNLFYFQEVFLIPNSFLLNITKLFTFNNRKNYLVLFFIENPLIGIITNFTSP